jgi:transposase
MGSPSQDAAERVLLVEQPAEPAGPSPLEGIGQPSRDAAERVLLVEQEQAPAGPSPLEGIGQPSRDAAERAPLTDAPAAPDEGSRVEAYGHPARDAAERVQITDQAPAPDEGSRVEAYGHPARDADERIAMRPEAPPAAQTALEGLGADPRTDAAERVEVTAGYIDAPTAAGPLEGYRDPSAQKIDRVDLHPEDEPAPNDTLGGLGAPSARRADRLRRVDEPEDELPAGLDALGEPSLQADDRVELFGPTDLQLPASTMEQAAQASRQRSDRVGAATAEDLAIAAAAAGELRLSTQREDRLGRPDDQDLPPSTLTGLESRSLMEAGRLTAREHRPAAYDNPNGLDAVMPHAGLRGVDRMRMPEADEDLPVDPALIGRVPVMPEEIELWGDLPPDERVGACGEPRRRLGERTHHRLDFRFQRYELLTVRRAVYDCPLCPEEEPVVATSPRFLSGGVPIGNGLLAQLVVARFGDHGNLSELANSMSRYGLVIEADKLDSATRKAAAAVQQVIAAIRAEVNEAKRVHIDARGLPTRRPGPQRDIVGELFCVSAEDQLYWAIKEPAQGADPGSPDPTEGAGGRKVREGEVAWNLLRDKLGWSREGRWGGLRHRLTVALITDPQRAAYGLFLVGALGQAAGPSGDKADLAARQRALKTWLDEQHATMDSPSTAMARAVSYALQLWPQLRHVDEAGRPIDEGEPRRFPKAWTAQWDLQSVADREALTTWCTLIGCCRRLGLRPWEYLYELFEAVANDALRDPAAWTPRAWAKASGA